ncbi:MAG: beta strand repeat-containing protein, partial [Chitinophagaceae bacterium]
SDTIYLSERIALRELQANKSINLNALSDYNDNMYPSVKATKDYIDNQVSNGAPDATINNKGIVQLTGDLTGSSADPRIANNAITTNKVADATITDAKIASGIQASKIGLGNVTNHAQVYSMNGLTAQVQNFATPGNYGLAPNWTSVGTDHTLNIPMANQSAVTAGLISKTDYDHFNTAYNNRISSFTTNGNVGAASLLGQSLNIPNYTLAGLSGNINPNYFLAGPTTGSAGAVQYRALVAADIPNNDANTSGNAATASALATPISINNISFDGTANITLKASTTNKLFFSAAGMGAMPTENFDGAAAKTISYNTIGAAPQMGSTNITTLGTIGTGVWNGAVIAESYGGAGTVNGILKADGNGLVSAASSSDFQVPLTFSSPLTNVSNTISMSQVSSSTSGYLSNTDWNTFNNKLSSSEKAVANGIATLDASGKIPTSQVPAISFSSGYVVNNQTQMLALSSAVVGSIAIRTDNSKNYVLSASDPANISNWLELLMPASVSSVNGYTTGSITLTSSDIAEGTNLYFNNTRVRSAVNGFLSGDAPMSYTTSTGKISITQATTHSNGYLSSTDWNTFNNKQSSMVGGTGVSISGGNTINIGQAVANTNSPSFAGITLSSLNVSGIVANTAAGVLTTVSTTGTGLVVKENTPTLITPNIGTATASSINATGDITAKRYKLTMPNATTASSSTSIDLSTGNVFTINLSANITSLTISNAAVGTYLIKFVQDATGSRTVSFPAAWKWAGGIAPTLTTTASKLDIVTLVYDGTLFYATIVKNF